MSNLFFSFKQFTVFHDRCAMKVGTDGVLLGAWTRVDSATQALDIGTGTGLIALMLAQRSQAQITAIDIDAAAVEQARDNVDRSLWKDRIGVELCDVCTYSPAARFDLIVSNPPYFVNSLKCPDIQRNTARHTDTLDFGRLIGRAAELLLPEGNFSVIIPADSLDGFRMLAAGCGLHLSRQTLVKSKPDALPKRALLEFVKQPTCCVVDELTIELSQHVYSDRYTALTKDFYLKM